MLSEKERSLLRYVKDHGSVKPISVINNFNPQTHCTETRDLILQLQHSGLLKRSLVEETISITPMGVSLLLQAEEAAKEQKTLSRRSIFALLISLFSLSFNIYFQWSDAIFSFFQN